MVGAKLKSLFEEQAKQRQQAAGGDKKSYDASVTQEVKSVSANLRSTPDVGKSAEKAAETVNVSTRSVEAASKVIKNGAPELVKAVEQGKIAIRPQYRVLARK